jgi:hypothetical protein
LGRRTLRSFQLSSLLLQPFGLLLQFLLLGLLTLLLLFQILLLLLKLRLLLRLQLLLLDLHLGFLLSLGLDLLLPLLLLLLLLPLLPLLLLLGQLIALPSGLGRPQVAGPRRRWRRRRRRRARLVPVPSLMACRGSLSGRPVIRGRGGGSTASSLTRGRGLSTLLVERVQESALVPTRANIPLPEPADHWLPLRWRLRPATPTPLVWTLRDGRLQVRGRGPVR